MNPGASELEGKRYVRVEGIHSSGLTENRSGTFE